MVKIKSILVMIIVLCVGGCGGYSVTFDSNPQGATLVCSGVDYGYTPKTLHYDINIEEYEFLNISDCTANWVSGAIARYGKISLKQFPNGVRTTAPRPNVAGYAEDANFALQVQQLEYQRRQAQAQENQLYEQQQNNRYNKNKRVTCSTSYGVTTCY